MLSRIADQLILCPSRDPIDPEGRTRRWVTTPGGKIEVWVFETHPEQSGLDVVAIKFPGTAGRAERGGPHPFELWEDVRCEIWTVNHAGYGGSEGVATVKGLAGTCDAVWEHVTKTYPALPVVLIGNSLGCVSALYLAARVDAAGIFLRNPVPLQQMIARRPRYNWWNFGLARLIADQVPEELDAVENARRSTCTALFVRSELDRVIPAQYQRLIFDSYGGNKSEFVLVGADHHHGVPESQSDAYADAVAGLRDKWLTRNHGDRS